MREGQKQAILEDNEARLVETVRLEAGDRASEAMVDRLKAKYQELVSTCSDTIYTLRGYSACIVRTAPDGLVLEWRKEPGVSLWMGL